MTTFFILLVSNLTCSSPPVLHVPPGLTLHEDVSAPVGRRQNNLEIRTRVLLCPQQNNVEIRVRLRRPLTLHRPRQWRDQHFCRRMSPTRSSTCDVPYFPEDGTRRVGVVGILVGRRGWRRRRPLTGRPLSRSRPSQTLSLRVLTLPWQSFFGCHPSSPPPLPLIPRRFRVQSLGTRRFGRPGILRKCKNKPRTTVLTCIQVKYKNSNEIGLRTHPKGDDVRVKRGCLEPNLSPKQFPQSHTVWVFIPLPDSQDTSLQR